MQNGHFLPTSAATRRKKMTKEGLLRKDEVAVSCFLWINVATLYMEIETQFLTFQYFMA